MELTDNDVISSMATCSAMRYLKHEPVSDEHLKAIVFAATRATSPRNTQSWEFVIVRDRQQLRRIGEALRPTAERMKTNASDEAAQSRMFESAYHLVSHLADVPAIVFVCVRTVSIPHTAPGSGLELTAAYAASQNLMVAARSLGLGTVFTMLHAANETGDDSAVRSILALPDDLFIAAMIPVGWPDRKFYPVRRRPVEEVIHWDNFGNQR